MNVKRQLHTLYIKHDEQFKTLSKIALSQLLLKIIHLQKNGIAINTIKNHLEQVIATSVPQADILSSIQFLIRQKKVFHKNSRYFIAAEFQNELNIAEQENNELHDYVIDKYFSKSQSNLDDVRKWFQDTTIKFFEAFSFEWFYQMTYRGKGISNSVQNLKETLSEILNHAPGILEEDKEWLKQQYNKFIDSEDSKDNLLFWQYGISMFASRLITARNYADEISVDMFKSGRFVLDTNILMILDLEAHELSASLSTLEKVLKTLSIIPCYFGITREEYQRAMHFRKQETIRVFNNYTIDVLKASDCAFIRTAINRGCKNEEDVSRMFDQLMDMPEKFHKDLSIQKYEFAELDMEIDAGRADSDLKEKLNDVYKRRAKRDKRDNPLAHDAGVIKGASFLRKSEKVWVVTSDSSLKIFAIENTVRDENELVVGLDVVLGVMAINSGGVDVEASNFAPLFKNIIKYALMPQSSAFELRDLAFILSTDTKINDLSDEKVIEVAREVKRKRISGEEDEEIALYLRRVIEGEKIGLIKDIQSLRDSQSIAKTNMEKVEKERDLLIEDYKLKRRGELRDKYDSQLRINRLIMFVLPVAIGLLLYLTFKFWLPNKSDRIQYGVGCTVELIFGLLPLFFVNRRLVRKHSEYVIDIDRVIDDEIREKKNKVVE